MPSLRLALCCAVLACLALWGVRLAVGDDLMNRDQERPVSYILDAVQNGSWIVQRDARGVVCSKPPLYTWIGAAAGSVVGVNQASWTLPALLGTVAAVVAVLLLGWRCVSPAAGMLAAGMFLASGPGTKMPGLVRNDGLFAGAIALAALAALLAWNRRVSWVWFYLAVTLATLAKGPLGLVFAACGLLAWWWERRRKDGPELPPRTAWRGHALGVGLFIVLSAGWFALALLAQGQDVWNRLIGRELVGHVVSGDAGARPGSQAYFPFFYLLTRYLPWSLVGLMAAVVAWRRPPADPLVRRTLRFLTCWLLGGLVLLAFAGHQRADLLMPLWAPTVLLAGWWASTWPWLRPRAQWPSDKGRLGAPSCTRPGKSSPPQRASPVFWTLTEGHWPRAGIASAVLAVIAVLIAVLYYAVGYRQDPLVAMSERVAALAQQARTQERERSLPLTLADVPLAVQIQLGRWQPSADGAATLLGPAPALVVASRPQELAEQVRAQGGMATVLAEVAGVPKAGVLSLGVILNRAATETIAPAATVAWAIGPLACEGAGLRPLALTWRHISATERRVELTLESIAPSPHLRLRNRGELTLRLTLRLSVRSDTQIRELELAPGADVTPW